MVVFSNSKKSAVTRPNISTTKICLFVCLLVSTDLLTRAYTREDQTLVCRRNTGFFWFHTKQTMKTTRGGWNLTVITLAVVFTLLQTAVTKSIFHEYDFSNPQNAIYSFTTNKLDFRVFKFYMSNHTNVQYFATRFEACTGQIFSLAVCCIQRVRVSD